MFAHIHARRAVVITKDSETAEDIGIAAFVESSADDMVLGYHLALLRPRTEAVDPRFLYWAMCSDDARGQLSSGATGVTRFGLRSDVIGSVGLSLPGRAEQREVAAFLNIETARIDALIGKKDQLASLLQTRSRSSAEKLVQAARARSSLTPLKYLVREIDERLGNRPPMEPLSVSIHHGVVPRSSMTADLPRAEEMSTSKVCRVGDIVVNRMRAFHGGIGRSPMDGVVSPDYTVLRPRTVSGRYLHHVVRSPWFVGEMTARLRGIGSADQGNVRTPRVNFADLGLIDIPLPSYEAQNALADSLDRTSSTVSAVLVVLRRQVDLLNEHRQALITAAVTGELDISGAAA